MMARATGSTPGDLSFLAVMKSANGQKTAAEIAEILTKMENIDRDGEYVRTKFSGLASRFRKENNGRNLPIPGPKGSGRRGAGRTSTKVDWDSALAQLGVVVDDEDSADDAE